MESGARVVVRRPGRLRPPVARSLRLIERKATRGGADGLSFWALETVTILLVCCTTKH